MAREGETHGMIRLAKNQLVQIRLAGTDDEWVRGVVVVAADTQPQSVAVLLEQDGMVRSRSGGFITGGVPLTIDYERETVRNLIGDEYEVEVTDETDDSR